MISKSVQDARSTMRREIQKLRDADSYEDETTDVNIVSPYGSARVQFRGRKAALWGAILALAGASAGLAYKLISLWSH